MTATSTRMRRRDYAAATKRQEPRIRWQRRCFRHATGLRPFLSSNLDLPALLAELARLGVHLLPHFLGDLHRAEVRPAHRAEVRLLRPLAGERLVVEGACPGGIEREVELVPPVELEPR